MIEHSITIKIASSIAAGLGWIALALGFVPAIDLVILQVEAYSILNPVAIGLLNDFKIVLGALVPALVVLKIYYEIKKVKKK